MSPFSEILHKRHPCWLALSPHIESMCEDENLPWDATDPRLLWDSFEPSLTNAICPVLSLGGVHTCESDWTEQLDACQKLGAEVVLSEMLPSELDASMPDSLTLYAKTALRFIPPVIGNAKTRPRIGKACFVFSRDDQEEDKFSPGILELIKKTGEAEVIEISELIDGSIPDSLSSLFSYLRHPQYDHYLRLLAERIGVSFTSLTPSSSSPNRLRTTAFPFKLEDKDYNSLRLVKNALSQSRENAPPARSNGKSEIEAFQAVKEAFSKNASASFSSLEEKFPFSKVTQPLKTYIRNPSRTAFGQLPKYKLKDFDEISWIKTNLAGEELFNHLSYSSPNEAIDMLAAMKSLTAENHEEALEIYLLGSEKRKNWDRLVQQAFDFLNPKFRNEPHRKNEALAICLAFSAGSHPTPDLLDNISAEAEKLGSQPLSIEGIAAMTYLRHHRPNTDDQNFKKQASLVQLEWRTFKPYAVCLLRLGLQDECILILDTYKSQNPNQRNIGTDITFDFIAQRWNQIRNPQVIANGKDSFKTLSLLLEMDVKQEGEKPETVALQCRMLLSSGETDRAQALAAKASELPIKASNLHLQLAIAFWEFDELETSRSYFQREKVEAIQSPALLSLYASLATLFELAEPARQAYRKLKDESPEFFQDSKNLGMPAIIHALALRTLGFAESADELIRACRTRYPHFPHLAHFLNRHTSSDGTNKMQIPEANEFKY